MNAKPILHLLRRIVPYPLASIASFVAALVIIGLCALGYAMLRSPTPPSPNASADATGALGAPFVGVWNNPKVQPFLDRIAIRPEGSHLAVQIDFETDACVGGFTGSAHYDSAQQAWIALPPPEEKSDCAITLQRQGAALRVQETPACLDYHGVACNFEGDFTRRTANTNGAPFPP